MAQEDDSNLTSLQPLQLRAVQERNDSIISINNESIKFPPPSNEKPDANSSSSGIGVRKAQLEQNEKQDDDNRSIIDIQLTKQPLDVQNGNKTVRCQESKLECDFSGTRSDTCTMLGDIRVLGKNSTIILSSPLSTNSTTMKIRPYAHKWEFPVMEHIKEVSITPLSKSGHVPTCSLQHSVPAAIFSTGGFLRNFLHDFTDVLVPLFATSRHFRGEVQFLVTNYNSKWIAKYKLILKQLLRYEIIDMDSETQLHCFPEAQLGLQSHKVLGMDPSKTPNGYSDLRLNYVEYEVKEEESSLIEEYPRDHAVFKDPMSIYYTFGNNDYI